MTKAQLRIVRIWCDINGRVVCDMHIGMEGSAQLKRRPNAKTITTTLTKWNVLNEKEISYLSKKYYKGGTICEMCNRINQQKK